MKQMWTINKKDEHLILGFDAREMWLDLANLWNENRKKDFLFRLDVMKPLSIDTMSWPSVFDIYSQQKPSFVGFYQELWENLEQLQISLKDLKEIRFKKYWLIAITLIKNVCNIEEIKKWESLLQGVQPNGVMAEAKSLAIANPSSVNVAWSLLGYDVADQWGTSALSNCGLNIKGYNAYDLRNKWGTCLNKYHLFDDLKNALSFKELSNERIKEHAPFFAFGVWLIKKHLGTNS